MLFQCRYEADVYSDWTEGVDEVAKANLDKPLLFRDQDSFLISVNFDPKVRYWHYLMPIGISGNRSHCFIYISLACCSAS